MNPDANVLYKGNNGQSIVSSEIDNCFSQNFNLN